MPYREKKNVDILLFNEICNDVLGINHENHRMRNIANLRGCKFFVITERSCLSCTILANFRDFKFDETFEMVERLAKKVKEGGGKKRGVAGRRLSPLVAACDCRLWNELKRPACRGIGTRWRESERAPPVIRSLRHLKGRAQCARRDKSHIPQKAFYKCNLKCICRHDGWEYPWTL